MKKVILALVILLAVVACNDKKKENENLQEIEKLEKAVNKIDSISVKIEKSTKDLEELLNNL